MELRISYSRTLVGVVEILRGVFGGVLSRFCVLLLIGDDA